MSKTKQVERINADAVQAWNDYRQAIIALGLPGDATPLEVVGRIKNLWGDRLSLARLLDEVLGAGRVSSSDDFRAAISAVWLLRHKVDNLENQKPGRAITYTPDDGKNVCHYHSGCKGCLENLEQSK